MRRRVLAVVAAVGSVVAACGSRDAASPGSPQEVPHNPTEWQIEYHVTGGLAGRDEYVSVNSRGDLELRDPPLRDHLVTRAPNDLVATVTTYLQTARPEKPATQPPIADGLNTSIVLTTGGKKYALEPTPDVAAAFENAFASQTAQAVVGTWREARWDLCTPRPQLTADDTDTTIDELVLHGDGTFSVSWLAATAGKVGARTPEAAPISGHYTLYPPDGVIRLRLDDQTRQPRDFAGEGQFSIEDGALILRRIWFGTRTAPHKPDICELTFVRK